MTMTAGIDRPDLSAEEIRVLGSLIEKQLTTPQQYPLTLNALVLACNQSSNRHPVISYDEATVELAVRTLKQKGLTRFVHPTHGRSVLRYEHVLRDALGVDQPQLGILAVLLLRGAQTVGEIRTRCERMVEFDDLEQVGHELDLLEEHAGGLVGPVPRRPGQKDGRFVHLLSTDDSLTVAQPPPEGDDQRELKSNVLERVESLTAEVAALRRDLDAMRAELGIEIDRGQ
jgi:uncharacterized protein YceH (UPF0502 family)